MDSFDNVVRKRFSSLFGKSSWLRKRLAKPRARKWLRGLKKRSGNVLSSLKFGKIFSLEKLSGPFRAFGTAFVGLGTSFKQLRGKLASPFKKLPGILQNGNGILQWFQALGTGFTGQIQKWLAKAQVKNTGLVYKTAQLVGWVGDSITKKGESIQEKAKRIREKGEEIQRGKEQRRSQLDLLTGYSEEDLSTCLGSIRSQSSTKLHDE
ncbi:hypothetical protein TruAng_003065 [Truncatella angustata]|nr:hypothetical protein TruAng_003065 [Truncatella angustata]